MTTSSPKAHKLYNLVIGLSGPYGSGCSSLAEELLSILNDWPSCICTRVPVSYLIQQWYSQIINNQTIGGSSDDKRREDLQKLGNELREKDHEIIGKIVANHIFLLGKDIEQKEDIKETGTLIWIVDSLKNTSDLKSLKAIFKDEFFFFFVTANTEIRWRRMRDYKSWKEEDKANFLKIDQIDSDQKQIDEQVGDSGQQVRKLAAEADYYIVNNETRADLHRTAYRAIGQIIGLGINQPSTDEKSMHVAFSSANQSACLSRQVGAAIFSKEGNILSIGHNDVPKAKGGLYSIEDENHDYRCLNVGEKRCINDTNKEERFKNLTNQITESLRGYLSDKALPDKAREDLLDQLREFPSGEITTLILDAVKKSEFKDATEYCRAVHAEMDALLSLCRNQNGSTIGATVYVTTQPCHNCVKHLITAGVEKVIYIEPYPKSLMEELHSDAINLNPQHREVSQWKISFIPYHGIAPRRYHDIFDMSNKRKDNEGKLCYMSKQELAFTPRFSSRVAKRTRLVQNNDTYEDLITINEILAANEPITLAKCGKTQEGDDERAEGENGANADGGGTEPQDVLMQ